MDWPSGAGGDRVPDVSSVASPGRYSLSYDALTLGERLGSGGQAAVHEATVHGVGGLERVAIKEPGVGQTMDVARVDAFTDEAEVWVNLDERERTKPRWRGYEHVVGVVNWGIDPSPWLAMEYMDGESLEDRLAEFGPTASLARALWTAWAVTRAVELAHSYGVAHLDLKPANVLFRRVEGAWDVPKVGDWGLARVLAEQSGSLDALSVRYAAPEQFEPEEFGDPDTLTDVYQVGALTYALLTGRPPYEGTRLQITRGVLEADPPDPPSTYRPGLPSEVDDLVLTALSAEKGDRYRTVQHLQEELVGAAERHAGHVDESSGSSSVTGQREPDAIPTGSAISSEEAEAGVDTDLTGHDDGEDASRDGDDGPASDAERGRRGQTEDEARAPADDAGPVSADADEPPLTSVSGLDESKAAALRAAGYGTVDALIAADQEDLAEVEGIGPALAARIKADVGGPDDGGGSVAGSLVETGRRLIGGVGDDDQPEEGTEDDDTDADQDSGGSLVGDQRAGERVDDEESMAIVYSVLLLVAAEAPVTMTSIDEVLAAARVGVPRSRVRAMLSVVEDEGVETLAGQDAVEDPYVYAALLLHDVGTPIEVATVTRVLEAASVAVSQPRVAALVDQIEDTDIESALQE